MTEGDKAVFAMPYILKIMGNMVEDETELTLVQIEKTDNVKHFLLHNKLEMCKWKRFKYIPCNKINSLTE